MAAPDRTGSKAHEKRGQGTGLRWQVTRGALGESSFSEGNRVELWKEGSLSTSFGESQRLFLGGT